MKLARFRTYSLRSKLLEAQFFYGRMLELVDANEFRFMLSAFLSALAAVSDPEVDSFDAPEIKARVATHKASINGTVLGDLKELRNVEVHWSGAPLNSLKRHVGPICLSGHLEEWMETPIIDLSNASANLGVWRVNTSVSMGDWTTSNPAKLWRWKITEAESAVEIEVLVVEKC